VDDDKQGRRKLQQLLEREGWSVLQAENGREALDRIAQQRPELILLDLMMPVMDGFEFSLELRRNPAWRNIPVVVLTAKDLTEEDRRRLNGHVESVLRKDAFSVDQLLSEVRQAILSCSVRMS
jgi:CheY-like chemotaxis protein